MSHPVSSLSHSDMMQGMAKQQISHLAGLLSQSDITKGVAEQQVCYLVGLLSSKVKHDEGHGTVTI